MMMDFKELVKKYDMNINGVFHIGGHYGEEFGLYHGLGINRVIAFDPNPKCVTVMNDSIVFNNYPFMAVNFALGASRGSVTLNDSSNESMSSSILKPKTHIQRHPNVKFRGTFEAEMRKLDDFFDTKINMINIDVQGYELEVFKGATKTLEHIDYIMAEINFEEVYEGCAQVGDLNEFLGSFGFELVEFVDTGHGWGDGLYVKRK